ncbi:MAG: ArnT family glycosyltransferase [Anaerolineae bacterium]
MGASVAQRTARTIGWALAPRLAELAGLASLLALAFWLRLGWAGVNSFGYDEGRLSLLALRLVRRGEWPVVGLPSSAGVPNLPAAVWIMALPYLLSTDPLVATLFVGCLNVLAVLGVWWLTRAAWGPWAGLTAGLLLAGSPAAVLYSRGIWSQDLLVPIAVLWALAGSASIRHGHAWALGLFALLAGLAFQVHYAGLALLVPTVCLLLRYRLWRRWPALVAGGGLAALLAWRGLQALISDTAVREGLRQAGLGRMGLDLTGAAHLAAMGVGAKWEWFLLGGQWMWPPPLRLGLVVARVAASVLVAGGLLTVIVGALRAVRCRAAADASSVLASLALAWALAAPLTFAVHSVPVYQQYVLASLPALAVAAASTASLPVRRPVWPAAVLALALLATVPQSAALALGLNVVAKRLTPGGMGTPLCYPQAAVRALEDGLPIVVHAHSDDPDYQGDAAGMEVLLWDYPHRLVDGRSALLLPAASSHLLFTFADLDAWKEARAAGVAAAPRQFARRVGEPPYLGLTLPAPPSLQYRPVTARLANGADLFGWQVRFVQGGLRLICYWHITDGLIAGSYHQFNHLRDDDSGALIANHDVPLSSPAWQPGDTLITWADLEVPARTGMVVAEVGMYTWPEVQRIEQQVVAGDPLAPIRLGPFDIGDLEPQGP